MVLPKSLTTVTTLSKVLAGLVFVALPFLGFFGGMWFAVTVLPVLQLLPVGNAVIADRYTFLPYLGICIAVTAATADYWHTTAKQKIVLPAGIIFIAFLVFFGGLFMESRLAGAGVYFLCRGRSYCQYQKNNEQIFHS